MQRLLSILGIFLVPATALALTFTDQTERYSDAPFTPQEAAGISLLTEVGAVEGNPDGTFAPDRTLNRAEFLKIVLLAHPNSSVSQSDADNCFPDVLVNDWFSRYVCHSKTHDIVGGYPDGFFRPANPVNYAEALKILANVFGYDVEPGAGESWYVPYAKAAQGRGTALPVALSYDAPLTRGLMARLAAAFRAELEGELDTYRAMESGVQSSAPTSSRMSSVVSSSSSSSSVVSSSSSSSVSAVHPAQSHFLLVGSRTPAIASGIFNFETAVDLRTVTLQMKKELRGVKEIYLIDATDKTLLTLKLDITDELDRRWRADAGPGEVVLPAGNVTLAFEMMMKGATEGGFPEELIEANTWQMIITDPSGNSINTAPTEWVHPIHQTALATLDTVTNAGLAQGTLEAKESALIGAFRFAGNTGQAPVLVEHLTFTPLLSAGVSVTGWGVKNAGGAATDACTIDPEGLVNCTDIPTSIGQLQNGAVELQIYGDVSISPNAQAPSLQVKLQTPGSTSELGAVQWSDGSAHYRWVEGTAPVAVGTLWTR